MTPNDMVEDPMDRAITRRLSRLAQIPIDTERLDRTMSLIIPKDRTSLCRRWIRSVFPPTASLWTAAIAFAGLLLVVVTMTRTLLPARPTLLSPSEIAEVHGDMVAEKIPTFRTKSVEEANRAIAAMAGDFPLLPDLPAAQAITCCLRTINGKPFACLLLNVDGLQVALMVTPKADVALPRGPLIYYDGRRYHVEAVGKLNMVMTEQSGRWVCLVAESTQDKLLEIAAQLRF